MIQDFENNMCYVLFHNMSVNEVFSFEWNCTNKFGEKFNHNIKISFN